MALSAPALLVWSGLLVQHAGAAYSFLTLGDWGAVALRRYHPHAVQAVADQMGKVAEERKPGFVVNVGDNFYYCGIQNVSDWQIQADYLSVYTAPGLQVPWYSALGNHEYGYNVDAQVALTQSDPSGRWKMPARYYVQRLPLPAGAHLTLLVLDTNPCIKAYRSESKSRWDPCGSDYPDCEPVDEGECRFHENILGQSCSEQHDWLKEQVQRIDKDDWLIVVGHHPADEINVEDLMSAFQDRPFDLYLNGHVHTLEHYSVDGNSAYVTSGAGGMVRTKDQENDPRCAVGAEDPGRVASVWTQKVAGFTLHTFSEDMQSLSTDFVDSEGNFLHSFTVKKGAGPAPSPAPGPQPSQCGGAGRYPCRDGCTYVHKRNEAACGVSHYGCYDCASLPSGCPECDSSLLV